MSYVELIDVRTGYMAPMGGQTLGTELTERYNAASPFPHIVIDDFLPAPLLDKVLAHCDQLKIDEEAATFDRPQERFKTSYQPDTLDDDLRALFYSFNSKPFIKLMENITGIKGLIPDPYFMGAGIHEIKQGGHLSVHADFNHHKPMNLERRINVLIYLNKDWKKEYGGSLELWDEPMTTRHHDIVPLFNRCVIFNTTSNSQHGNPEPIAHPQGISRKSIALYYYTSTWDGSKRSHTTQFQVRPGSADKRDWQVKLNELKNELLPPIIARRIRF
ncbi:2OG-Fe(II) oxygenase [Sphingomonas sp. Tas61C01]|uniref:2OG-Fe(II) oxygenase n=1 Tax=Sphingomonas sp. Tas61C01 TaxID=3458297 RepID=UPI00403E84BE